MASDIVERLRAASLNPDEMRQGWLAEAIDEIERLREAIQQMIDTSQHCTGLTEAFKVARANVREVMP